MREAAAGLSAILDVEMNLHVKLSASWGLAPDDLEQASPAVEMLAYTRYVLDTGMRGDLLALQGGPCPLRDRLRRNRGAARRAPRRSRRNEPVSRLDRRVFRCALPAGRCEGAGAAERLADLYATPAREAELVAIFKEATRLEADFWEMGWRAGQRANSQQRVPMGFASASAREKPCSPSITRAVIEPTSPLKRHLGAATLCARLTRDLIGRRGTIPRNRSVASNSTAQLSPRPCASRSAA